MQFLDGGGQMRLLRGMGADQQRGTTLLVGVLPHSLDRHAVLPECRGDLREHTGPVGDVQADQIAGGGLADRARRQSGIDRLRLAGGPRPPVTSSGHQISQYCTGRRFPAGTAAVEHHLPGRFRLHEDGVECVVHAGQRVRLGDQCRMHPGHDALAIGRAFGHGQQFDDVTEIGRGLHVPQRHRTDALAVDIAKCDAGVERESCQDCGFCG